MSNQAHQMWPIMQPLLCFYIYQQSESFWLEGAYHHHQGKNLNNNMAPNSEGVEKNLVSHAFDQQLIRIVPWLIWMLCEEFTSLGLQHQFLALYGNFTAHVK